MNKPQFPRRARGVTLIELVTVMAVIGILSAISIPAYTSYVLRVNRTDAKRALLEVSSKLERCFTRGNDYTVQDIGGVKCVTLPFDTPEGTYTIDGDIQKNKFTLTATPIKGQARDTKCKIFTIEQSGAQSTSGGSSDSRKCWEGRD